MGTPKQNGQVFVLVALPDDRRGRLLEHLGACGMAFLPVHDCKEACRILQADPRVEVIVTDPTLPGGSWADLVAEAARCRSRAKTVICMRKADPMLWIDVLEGGAFDVLVEPYQTEEVKRIVGLAAEHCRNPLPTRRGSGPQLGAAAA